MVWRKVLAMLPGLSIAGTFLPPPRTVAFITGLRFWEIVPTPDRPTAVRWDAALAARSALFPLVTAPFCALAESAVDNRWSAGSLARSLARLAFRELRAASVPFAPLVGLAAFLAAPRPPPGVDAKRPLASRTYVRLPPRAMGQSYRYPSFPREIICVSTISFWLVT